MTEVLHYRGSEVDALSSRLLATVLCPNEWHEAELSPEAVRRLSVAELKQVAADLRADIVRAVEANGGHLGPNLGAVELSLAIHRTFRSPHDIVLWDAGHQCYAHKMITGRRGAFTRLRRAGGLSGYPSRAESVHDWVENSHAGGALSWAHGCLKGLQAQVPDRDRRVVVVVGDGALTSGIAYEALNNLGLDRCPVVVVLNDNGRSYAPTRSRLFGPDPADGPAGDLSRRAEACGRFFTALGFSYRGPIDGLDVEAVSAALREARDLQGPVVVHARTVKGKGYEPAERDEAIRMHDVSPPKAAAQPGTSFTDTFVRELAALIEADDRVVAVTAGMATPTGLAALEPRYPDRIFDVGVAEQHAATFAAGLALAGCRPVVALGSTFFNRCFDQFLLDVSLHDVPVVFVLDRAGITGPDGPSHHGVNDLALALAAPATAVYTPSCPDDVGPALREAMARRQPAVVRVPEGQGSPLAGFDGPAGTTRQRRRGDTVCVAAVGAMVQPAWEAAALLEDEGVGVDLWDLWRVRPIDERFLDAALRSSVLVTVEDGSAGGGAGAWIGHQLGRHGWRGHVRHLGVPDTHAPHGSRRGILSLLGLDAEGIAAACRAALESRAEVTPR